MARIICATTKGMVVSFAHVCETEYTAFDQFRFDQNRSTTEVPQRVWDLVVLVCSEVPFTFWSEIENCLLSL